LKDDGTVFSGEIRSASSEFHDPSTLHVTTSGDWVFAFVNGFGSFATAQLVGGPVPAFTPLITTFWDGTQPSLVMPQEPVYGQGARFVGNVEFGLLASPCGPLSLQANAYRNSDGTFTCYEAGYIPDVGNPAAENIYTGASDTYTVTSGVQAVNTTKQMCTDAGVQFDPSNMFFQYWQEQQLHSAPQKPVTTINYFWQNVIQAQETPVITTS
jgi:hypothetical protein